MRLEVFWLSVLIVITIYNLLLNFMRRRERLNVIEKLSDAELAGYLGKAPEEEQPGTLLDRSLWWLFRLAGLTIGIAAACLVIFLLHRTIGLDGANFADAMLILACFFFFGTVGVVVELVIERAVRKPSDR